MLLHFVVSTFSFPRVLALELQTLLPLFLGLDPSEWLLGSMETPNDGKYQHECVLDSPLCVNVYLGDVFD